jgi:hypothetical protein
MQTLKQKRSGRYMQQAFKRQWLLCVSHSIALDTDHRVHL